MSGKQVPSEFGTYVAMGFHLMTGPTKVSADAERRNRVIMGGQQVPSEFGTSKSVGSKLMKKPTP